MKRLTGLVVIVANRGCRDRRDRERRIHAADANHDRRGSKVFPRKDFGTVRPTTIFLGGDESGLFCHIKWSSWGGQFAVGTGTGWYLVLPPGRQRLRRRRVLVHLIDSMRPNARLALRAA
jgi:hypothetical protein